MDGPLTIETRKTSTHFYQKIDDIMNHLPTMEEDGWAVRQVACLSESMDAVAVVYEIER